MKFILKEATLKASILKIYSQPGHVYVIQSDLELAGRKKTYKWLTKIYFFQAIIHLIVNNAFSSKFGACLVQNNIAQEQP